ncbi:hypothetical protein IBX65_02360 [Candidatus Aerophobetes bacterium]|nr:hypothetical protein [Candidatus Aerophobetes bacterium]
MDYKTLQYELTGLNTLLNLTEASIEVFPVKPSPGHIQFQLSSTPHKIKINIHEDWNISEDHLLTSYLNKTYHEHPIFEMSQDLLFNNAAHSQVCPASLEIHHRLLNIVAEELKKKNKEMQADYVCHALEDIICNCWCKLNFGHFKGMVIFYYDQLNHLSPGNSNKRHFSKRSFLRKFLSPLILKLRFGIFYEFFVRTNLYLWGEEDDFSFLQRFFSGKREIEDATGKMLDILQLKDSASLEETVEVLCDRARWEKFTREFSLLTAELIENVKEENEKVSCEMWFEKEIMDEDVRKKFIKRMYYETKEKPDYIENIEVTKVLYEILAPEIPIQVDMEKRGRAMPVVPFNYEPFHPQFHSTEDIDLGGVVVDAESPFFNMVNFRVPKYHYDIFIPYRSQRERAFPDICFLLDTSASMADDVESKINIQSIGMVKQIMNSRFYFGEGKTSWSEKSKYHHVLLGFNGAIKWLQSKGIAPYIRYNVITFSHDTLTSGWREYSQLDECKKIAYLPQFDTTLIDNKVIENELLAREPFVLIILSDGEIFNWNESTKAYSPNRLRDFIRGVKPVKYLFKQIVENNMVSHIQISEGDFKPRISILTCRDLAEWGAEIHRINDVNSLQSLMVRITRRAMSSYL